MNCCWLRFLVLTLYKWHKFCVAIVHVSDAMQLDGIEVALNLSRPPTLVLLQLWGLVRRGAGVWRHRIRGCGKPHGARRQTPATFAHALSLG